eukprot:TRINITY_DN56064_c0_g1_i1.p1 TRINITY_DN56064_c0_g1~~TRINITY_DN56064_c0_g1_i1.p1  ORF type:complete len:383 (-),score=60.84 TRINITY_DN56064_c0_g1_i1:63-1211(-)
MDCALQPSEKSIESLPPEAAAQAWQATGNLHLQQNDSTNALIAYLEGMRALAAASALESPACASMWSCIGNAKMAKNDLVGAADAYESACSVYDALGKHNSREVVSVLTLLGQVRSRLEEDAAAVAVFDEVRSIRSSLSTLETQDGVALLTEIAHLKKRLGDVDGAVEAVQEARRCQAAIVESTPRQPISPPAPSPGFPIGTFMVNQVLAEASEIVSSRPPTAPNTARRTSRPTSARSGVVETKRQQEDLQRMAAQYAEERAMMEATKSLETPQGAELLMNIGIVRRLLGDLDGAASAYQEARRIDEATRVQGSPVVVPSSMAELPKYPAGYPFPASRPMTPGALDGSEITAKLFAAGNAHQAIRQARRLEAKVEQLRSAQQ